MPFSVGSSSRLGCYVANTRFSLLTQVQSWCAHGVYHLGVPCGVSRFHSL